MKTPGNLRRYLTAYGTRPEAIKLAPLVEQLRKDGNEVTVVNTGQHYDPNMNEDFTHTLGMRVDETHTGNDQTPGKTLTDAMATIARNNPDAVLLLGDTTSVPLYAWAARNAGTPVIHVEAGLRSRNGRSLEEVNRRMAAAAASIHYAPTRLAKNLLLQEGLQDERIIITGNTITDTLRLHGPHRTRVENRAGILLTAHRASNVDNPERLQNLVTLTRKLAGIDHVLFPIHPRTLKRLNQYELINQLKEIPDLTITGPLNYPTMLAALAGATLIVTDSGGVQEEASWYGIPAIVLRRTTPRWESVQAGITHLNGIDTSEELESILEKAKTYKTPTEQARIANTPCLYGDGHAAEHITSHLKSPQARQLLQLREDAVDLDTLPW